uniref:Lipase maturation factor n=1 Tax=Oncorhynchus kisutch TaxID=8019 RepID=A0A8C7DRV9_ONCKI
MGETRLPRHMFLWSMAIIYMFAFASLYVQIPGLYGNEGVLPVRLVEPRVDGSRPVLEQIHAHPSLLWLGPRLGLDLDAQQAMELLCLAGALLALGAALLEPLRDSLVFFCLWALYLSLCQVGQDFLRFQWDSLLLEAGFLTVLVAPLNLLRWRSAFRQHDAVTFWLVRWLLFRLTFGSGVAKLASHCPSWWGLTAVKHMFEAQGIPLPWSWFIQQLPDWYLKLGTVGLLVTEIAVPALYFAPIRHLRLAAFYIQVLYQVKLMFVGNYGFLPFLSLALTFSLLDDDHISYWLGHGKKKSAKTWHQTIMSLVLLAVFAAIIYGTKVLFTLEMDWEAKTMTSKTAFTQQQFGNWLKLVTGPTIWVGVLSLTWEVVAQVYSSKILPEVRQAYSLVERYRLVSAYSLDSRVDGRSEVVFEGSMDKNTWTEIEFMYKPGNVGVAPPVVAPHQPRLDWQMSQAAQGLADQSPWFTSLVHCLLQGNKDVVRLIQTDSAQYPFSQAPPVYLRASLYRYWSGPKEWWRRDYSEEFYPAVQLGDPTLEGMLNQHGLKETFPIQPSPDSPLAQALKQVRGHVQTLPDHLVLWSLLATVATIWLFKTLLSGVLGGRKAKPTPAEPKAKKAKAQPAAKNASASSLKAGRETSEESRRDADKSPKKRK